MSSGAIGSRPASPTNIASGAVALYQATDTGILSAYIGGAWADIGSIPLVQTFTPALQGASDNPTVTYGTRIGRYYTIGKLCFVQIVLTSTTMTKTTLTDAVRVSLPIAAANISNAVNTLHGRVENSTAVIVASVAETTPNASYLQFRQLNAAAASALQTYALLSLGVLTNTVTVSVSGFYETT